MENKGFKVGDVVVVNPSKETLSFINLNNINLELKKFIGEKAVVINSDIHLCTTKVQYLKLSTPIHVWDNKDLTLVPTEREFLGEV